MPSATIFVAMIETKAGPSPEEEVVGYPQGLSGLEGIGRLHQSAANRTRSVHRTWEGDRTRGEEGYFEILKSLPMMRLHN